MSEETLSAQAGRVIEYDLGPKDGEEYIDYVLKSETTRAELRAAYRRLARMAAAWAVFIPGTFAGLYAAFTYPRDERLWMFAGAGLAAWGAIWATTLLSKGMERRIRQNMSATVRTGWPFGPRRVELAEAGVATTSPIFEGMHFWSAIKEVSRGAGGVYITTVEKRVILVPARAFASEGDAEAFVVEVRGMMERGKAKHPPVVHRVVGHG